MATKRKHVRRLDRDLAICQNAYTYSQYPTLSQPSCCSGNDPTSCYNLGHDAGYTSAEKEIARCHEVSFLHYYQDIRRNIHMDGKTDGQKPILRLRIIMGHMGMDVLNITSGFRMKINTSTIEMAQNEMQNMLIWWCPMNIKEGIKPAAKRIKTLHALNDIQY